MTDSNAPSPTPIYKRWAEYVGFFIAFGTVFSGGYWLGDTHGKGQLDTYEFANKLDLPSLTKETTAAVQQLRVASNEFATMLANNQTYEDMKRQFTTLSDHVKSLSAAKNLSDQTLVKTQTDLKEALDKIALLTNPDDVITVEAGTAVTIRGGLLTVGLREVSIGGVASIAINGNPRDVNVGDLFTANGTDGNPCTIKVMNVAFVGSILKFTAKCSRAPR
jgi:hypothetical protein